MACWVLDLFRCTGWFLVYQSLLTHERVLPCEWGKNLGKTDDDRKNEQQQECNCHRTYLHHLTPTVAFTAVYGRRTTFAMCSLPK